MVLGQEDIHMAETTTLKADAGVVQRLKHCAVAEGRSLTAVATELLAAGLPNLERRLVREGKFPAALRDEIAKHAPADGE